MTINPNSPIDNATQVDTQKSAQQRASNNPNANAASNHESPASEALSAFSRDQTEGAGGIDMTAADQLMQGLAQTMAGNLSAAVGAHAGLNATSVFDLIQ